MMKKILKFKAPKVWVYDEPMEMGRAAADHVEGKLKAAILEKGFANLILATGTSQFQFLDALKEKELDWQKITVFHLDEYLGITDAHPASFQKYLKDRILTEVKPKQVYFLNGSASDIAKEVAYYSQKLKEHPIDIACIGIGENGHIAFNDPPVADFTDPKWVKVVTLDVACRNQQLGEGWFSSLEEVPEQALTLTIPAIMHCKSISCVVPDTRKAEAVYNCLYGKISENCPASILRTHPESVLFLDKASAKKIK